MKKRNQIIAMILAILLLFSSMPVYAMDQNSEVKQTEIAADKTIEKIKENMLEMQTYSLVVVSTYEELKNAIDSKENSIHIANDIQLEDVLSIDYDVYFSASGTAKTLFSAPEKRHITASGESVQLQFNNVILDGNYKDDGVATGGIQTSANNNTFVNPVIKNCYSKDEGGGICANIDCESFIIYGGEILNNSAKYGGGIYTFSKDVLVADSIFDNNSAWYYIGSGGAIVQSYNKTNSTIHNIVIKNTTIKNNTAWDGGGIYLRTRGTCILDKDTVIQNNVAKADGGGIDATYLTEITSYAKILNNEAKSQGGGVNFAHIFNMNGGEISANKSTHGGGINSSYIFSTININDGLIEKNIAKGQGAGLCVLGSTIMTDGIIQDNGYYEDDNGEIVVETSMGGGIYAKDINITGGFIYSNMAKNGGGIYVDFDFYNPCVVIIKSPAYVRYNEATNYGGGIYLPDNAVYDEMSTSRIRNNSAGVLGNQYYVASNPPIYN